ncbi:hypothetical protein Glove_530g18 [Diversispora epigaea]|uniref:Uncharacterized protein n=1 Tax=Diversispora epigaea TaxID=1348612 RepID=A0A397GF55_9GLOM|nr:hypothetical protein Glove_530g18 [Diversispora epigaea]
MDLSEFPSEVRITVVALQNILRSLGQEGTLKISNLEIEYEETSTRRPSHTDRVHGRLPYFIAELRRECTDLTPLPSPPGESWEEQIEIICGGINLVNNNIRNEEQLQLYYQLGSLLSLRGFNATSRSFAKTILLAHKRKDFFPTAKRTYFLYSARGSWHINGTVHILCYALCHMSESDFQDVLLPETEEAKTREILSLPFDIFDF